MNKRVKNFAGAGLAALALVVAGGGYYHFHVQNDTPAFAIESITRSIEHRDLKEFNHAVNLDSLLDSGYDGFIDGLTSTDAALSPDGVEVVKNFTQMLRAPMMLTMKAAVESFVSTGELKPEENAGVIELLERIGLNDVEVRAVKNIEVNDADRNEAFADVIIFQPELGREFSLQLILSRGKDDRWQVTRIKNFQDYVKQIIQARRIQLDEYLSQASEINSRHAAIIRDGEQRYGMILSLGNLSQNKTRADLKTLVDDVFKEDWQQRKQELFSLHVPKDAQTLHGLYMRICDLSIAAAQDYSKWLDDNNSLTIKSAEDKIHQVQALMTQAGDLAARMTK